MDKMTDNRALEVLGNVVGHLRPILGHDSYTDLLAARDHIAALHPAAAQENDDEQND